MWKRTLVAQLFPAVSATVWRGALFVAIAAILMTPSAIALTVVVVAVVVPAIYMWSTRRTPRIQIYEEGVELSGTFIPWSNVDDISKHNVGEDVQVRELRLLLTSGSVVTEDIDDLNKSPDEIYRLLKREFHLRK